MRSRHLALGLLLLLAPSLAQAARYHVRTTGTRTSGPSQPGNWNPANCYSTLAAASLQAAASDTVLLYKEDHNVLSALTLPAFLGNSDLDDAASDCRVWLAGNAGFTINFAVQRFTVRGLAIEGVDPSSPQSVLVAVNSMQLMQEVNLEDCSFINNHGSHSWQGAGSCLFARENGHGMAVNVRRCVFRLNGSDGPGGVIYMGDGYQMTLEDCEFTDNYNDGNASEPGGAIAVVSPDYATSVVMRRCTLQHNRALGAGGAIDIDDGELTMEDCDVSYNESGLYPQASWSAGAGLFMRRTVIQQSEVDNNLELTGCTFRGNMGYPIAPEYAGDGGGVLVKGYSPYARIAIHVADCLFEENFNAQGAGLYVGRYVVGLVERTRFLNNTALLCGGGSYKGGKYWFSLGETARYEYCEFVGNRAGYDASGQPSTQLGQGGAFMTRLYPRAEFYNCTFANNLAGGPYHQGDAIFHSNEGLAFTDSAERCDLVNCIFYGSVGNDIQVRSDPTGFNLVNNCAYADGQFVCDGTTPVATVSLTASPFVSADDRHLQNGSLCIDHGQEVNIPIDLVGTAVPQGMAPDIGAYEYIDDLSGIGEDRLPLLSLSLQAYPNPFNPRTTIEFELADPGDLRLSVYDLAGRELAVLAAGQFPSGPSRVSWFGTDSAGHAIGSGVYIAKLQTAGQSRAIKLMLVR